MFLFVLLSPPLQTLSYSLWNKPEWTTESISFKLSTDNEVQNSLSSSMLSLLEEPNEGFRTSDRANPTWQTTMRPKIFITESPMKSLKQKWNSKPSISTTDNSISLTNRNSHATTYSSTIFPKQYQTLPITSKSSDHNLINVPVLEVVFPGRNNGGETKPSKKSNKESEYNFKSGVNIFQDSKDKGLFSFFKKEPSLHLTQGQSVWNLHSTSKLSSSPTTPKSEGILPCDEETETSTSKLKQEDSLTEGKYKISSRILWVIFPIILVT